MDFLVPDNEFWIKAAFSILCGFVVGIERQLHKKPIDTRTTILICLGTTLFVELGLLAGGTKDDTRVLGQIITGIGFLGAGTIITRPQGAVAGLTSASVVWVVSAIGAAIGFGEYGIALVVSVLTVIILAVFQWVETLTERLLKPRQTPPVG